MSDAVTKIEAELFANRPIASPPQRRCVVLRDTDLRTILATGRLRKPACYSDIAPLLNDADGWTTIEADRDSVIQVREPNRACLAILRASSGVGERVTEELPSLQIETILFPSEAAMRQWSAKSKTFAGLPQPIPFTLALMGGVRFDTAPATAEARWAAPELLRDEKDRVAGALVGALVQGHLSRQSWDALAALQNPSRRDLEDLWAAEHHVDRNAVGAAFDVIGDSQWGVGFDPTRMLERLHSALRPHYDASDLDAWRTYVSDILSNREVAKQEGLRDAGKTLLRALELFLRTPQPSIARIADEIRIRASGARSEVGRHVGGQALALAGWFEGFAAADSIVKHERGLYGVGARVAANSKHHPLRFESAMTRSSTYGRSYVLLESGLRIAEFREEPPPLLLKALHAAQEVCSQMSWQCAFDEERYAIVVQHSDWKVRASLVDRDVLCWQCDFDVPKIPKQRTWPKGFVDWVFATAGDWRCSVASSSGFPRLQIRHHAWLRTLDDEEVRFAIVALLGARDSLIAWRPKLTPSQAPPAL